MPPAHHQACSRDFTFYVSDAHPQHPVPNADQTPTPEPSSAVCTFTRPPSPSPRGAQAPREGHCPQALAPGLPPASDCPRQAVPSDCLGHSLTQRPRSLPTSAQSSDSEGDAATRTSVQHVGSLLPTPDPPVLHWRLTSQLPRVKPGRHHHERRLSASEA